MKKFVALALVLVMAFSLAACSSSPSGSSNGEEVVTLSIAHIRPEGSPADLAVKAFCAEATELSGGTLQFDIYPASQLGDYTTVQERVIIGDVDMQIASIGTNINKSFGLITAPFLAATWTEAAETFGRESVFTDIIKECLTGCGLTYLCGYPLYFGGIALATENPNPTDPDFANGIKIRVPSMTSFEATADGFGYLATPLPASETFTAMQTGVVDGAIGMGAEGYYSNMADLIKQYLPINDHFEQWYMYINADKFASLSDVQKSALETAAANMEAARWEVAEAETAEYEKKLADNGTVIVDFTDDQLVAFAEKARANVWPLIYEEYGAEYFDRILVAMGKEPMGK